MGVAPWAFSQASTWVLSFLLVPMLVALRRASSTTAPERPELVQRPGRRLSNRGNIGREFPIEITAARSRVREAVSVGGRIFPTTSEVLAFNAIPP